MGNSLFLKGDSGTGKTTLLSECLRPWQEALGGFYTRRLVDEKGDTMGFQMVPACEELVPRASYEKGLSNVFLERTEMGMKRNLEVFEKTGVELLRSSANKRLCLMDEIGGVELFAPGFMNELRNSMERPVPIIGVIKSRKNLNAMAARIPILPESDRLNMELEEEILKCTGRQVLTFERKNEDIIRQIILDFLKNIQIRQSRYQ